MSFYSYKPKMIYICKNLNQIIMENKNLNPVQKTIVGVQFLFVAFGATVLVPLLVGMDPSVALFTAGIGTLIFHLVTKGKVPSSWAVVSPSSLLSSRLPNSTGCRVHSQGLLLWVLYMAL